MVPFLVSPLRWSASVVRVTFTATAVTIAVSRVPPPFIIVPVAVVMTVVMAVMVVVRPPIAVAVADAIVLVVARVRGRRAEYVVSGNSKTSVDATPLYPTRRSDSEHVLVASAAVAIAALVHRDQRRV